MSRLKGSFVRKDISVDHARKMTGNPNNGRRLGLSADDTTLLLALDLEELLELTPGELRLLRAVQHEQPGDTSTLCGVTSQQDYVQRMRRLLVRRRTELPVETELTPEELVEKEV